MGSGRKRGAELTQWGEYAAEQLRGPVLTGLRKRLAAFRDPRARLIRRRKWAKRTTVAGGTTTGLLGGGAFFSWGPQFLGVPVMDRAVETALDAASFGIGGLALAAGVGTVGAWRKYRGLKRTPLPEPPPEPVSLPAHGSQAHEPMRRLREAEKSLHDALTRLSEGASVAGESVADARTTSANAATALREVADRLVAVEGALPHAPESERETLRADVRRLRSELDEGVESYGHLVAAAGRAVAASGASEQQDLVRDATDRLAGLATALRELSGNAPGSPMSAADPDRRDKRDDSPT